MPLGCLRCVFDQPGSGMDLFRFQRILLSKWRRKVIFQERSRPWHSHSDPEEERISM